MLQNLIDIFTAPRAVFARLRERPTVLLPLLLLVVATSSIQVGYIATTDRGFFVDQMVEQALNANPTLRETELRTAYENLSPTFLMATGGLGTAVAFVVILLLYAVYLNFMSKFSHDGYRYQHWLSLLSWTGLPALFTALSAWLVMLSGNGQVSLGALQPLSLDTLLGINSGKQLLLNLSLPQLWSSVLLVLGYQSFTQSTWLRATLVALAPMLLIYGIWGWFSLR
ncbi:MAG TPA: YIP1 family protein [Hyphomicrobiales bacterium]|nr:YIP1 family protein [Hyphomicrobiales bacterium]